MADRHHAIALEQAQGLAASALPARGFLVRDHDPQRALPELADAADDRGERGGVEVLQIVEPDLDGAQLARLRGLGELLEVGLERQRGIARVALYLPEQTNDVGLGLA